METLIIIGGLIFIIGVWTVKVQNQLVNSSELCSNALSQIGVEQTSRWDVLTNLADLLSQYSEYEGNTIKDIIEQRSFSPQLNSAAELEQNEQLLKETYKHINISVEAYPTLKADKLYLDTMGSIRKYEENIRYSRMIYNDTVTKLNREIKMIPTCFISGLLGFKVKEYLEVDVLKTDIPKMSSK